MNILVPTDFSEPSQQAFRFALQMAKATESRIDVVHMVELPMILEVTFGIHQSFEPGVTKAIEQKASAALRQMRDDYGADVDVTFTSIQDQMVPGVIAFIEAHNIDLVIMSIEGAHDADEFYVATKAEKIARLAPVPVITIPKAVDFDSIKNIVFANTLDEYDDELVEKIKTLQKIFDAKLHVLFVNTPLNFYNDLQAKKHLEDFARHYELENFTLNFRDNQFEKSGILAFVDEIKADMITMATRGRTGLAHFFNGSVAESVLNRTDKPIWTWRRTK